MGIEVKGGPLTQQFESFNKKLAAKAKSKGERKRELIREWNRRPEISSRFNSENYRLGWDLAFSSKNETPGKECPYCSEEGHAVFMDPIPGSRDGYFYCRNCQERWVEEGMEGSDVEEAGDSFSGPGEAADRSAADDLGHEGSAGGDPG